MRTLERIIISAAILIAGTANIQAQETTKAKFNPDYSIQDISAEGGVLAAFNGGSMDAGYFQLTYSRLFWKHFAYRAGLMAAPDMGGFGPLAGIPLGISWKTGTVSFEDAASYALTGAINNAVWDGLSGHSDEIGSDMLTNLLFLLFRRWEFFVGVTPAYYAGNFALLGDAGVTLSIPIWRLTLNISPVFHYSFLNDIQTDGDPTRIMMSLSGGLSWLF